MKKISSLKIPPNKKFPGLVRWCNLCKTNIYDICRQNDKPLNQCVSPESQRYKYYGHVPGSTHKCTTKTFQSRDYDEVLSQVIELSQKLKNPGMVENTIKSKPEKSKEMPETNSDNLLLLMSKYLEYVHGTQNIPLHLRKARSKQYTSDIEHGFALLIDMLKRERYYVASLTAGEVDKHIVGKFFEHLQFEKMYSNRTVNKNISFFKSFYRFITKQEGIQLSNPFEFVVKLPEIHNPQAITKEEFTALLNAITPENGILEDGGVKARRTMYFNWLKNAYRLILFSGTRREQVINYKWSDIIRDKEGQPALIATEDRKVNNIMGRTGNDKKINYVPITDELYQLLLEMGYEKYKDTEQYILAPEITLERNKSMADAMSRSFSFFFKKINSTRNLKLKSIRKAYLTAMEIRTGDAKIVSGHSGSAVLQEHYLDKAMIAQSLRNFSVFGNTESERMKELKIVRTKHKGQNISLEK